MQKAIECLIFLLVLLFLIQVGIFGKNVQLIEPEEISIETASEFKEVPKSFCITEDGLFLIPNEKAGVVKIFGYKKENYLIFIKELGPLFGNDGFSRPIYCIYNRIERKLGVLDYGLSKVLFFTRSGKIGFTLQEIVNCPKAAYDIGLYGDRNQLVISFFKQNKEGKRYDLYSINIRSQQITYLLPSHEKYNLKDRDAYQKKYRKENIVPAIGIKAFFDISGNDLFFAWEGALRIIKLNLISMEKKYFGKETSYTKPDGTNLVKPYKKEEKEKLEEMQKEYSYIRNIFASSRYVFLVYETGKNKKNPIPSFNLQIYNPETYACIDEIQLDKLFYPDKDPYLPMWLDKDNYDLYSLSRKTDGEKGEFSILKYKIKIKK